MPPEAIAGLRAVHMEAMTDGLGLTLDIEHRYENRSAGAIEVIYTFPIPFDAVILGVDAERDGQVLSVVLRDAMIAEDTFEAAQMDGRFAVLIERCAPGICTASLGSLAPGSRARLRVRIGRFLEVAGGGARIVAPSVAAMPEGSRRGAVAGPLGAPSASLLVEYPLTFRLTLVGGAASVEASSPTHVLERSASQEAVVLSLAEPASLDRDVVVTLAGLPTEDGGWMAFEGGRLAVAATTPPIADERHPMNAVVLVDAAGPLGPLVHEMSELLKTLVSEWEPEDRLGLARIGRTICPDPLAIVGADGLDDTVLDSGGADLGDIAPGASPPLLDLAPGADLCLVTDGRTRVAEALAEGTAADGRRLFVLGVGSAPDAGWLHPAALATRGDYISLAPGEALERAAHRLLGALTLPPIGRPPARWSGSPLWSDGPDVWRSGLRGVVCAVFEDDAPETLTLAFEPDQPVMHLPQLAGDGGLAKATARVAAAQRLPSLEGEALRDWARRFSLPIPGAAWLAEAAGEETGEGKPPRLVATPQMVAAGWRGIGRLTPIPAPLEPAHPSAPPARSEPRSVGARRPSGLWIAAVAVVSAGLGVWGARRSTSPPQVASSERFPLAAARTGSPVREADAVSSPSKSSGAEPGRHIGAGPRRAPIGWIGALMAAAVGLVIWLRRRRRRPG